MADVSKASRRSPLYTCGASALTIVWNLYTRAIKLDGPVGLVARRLAKAGSKASPLVCVIQYQWLTALSFIDFYILAMENIIEKCVPLSRHVFDRIDNMLNKVDSLPIQFERLSNRLPIILEKIPVLELAMIGVSDSEKEKEIRVDTNFDNAHNKQEDTLLSNPSEAIPAMKCSYKEALEKGVKEDENADENLKEIGNESKEDPLVELLDFGWETPRTRYTMSRRSASYT